MNWFVQERQNSTWVPVLYTDQPPTKVGSDGLRIVRTGSIGPRIKSEPVKVKESDRNLPFHALKAIYGTPENVST